MRRLSANLAKGEVRRATLDGRAYVVVPVIMARGDVVMNATLVPPSEFEAFAWNGVPVTHRHPQSDGGAFLSANTPAAIEKYRIGNIYNTDVADKDLGDKAYLRGEVWLDEVLTNKKAPGLISQLEAGGAEINVSTGFFSDLEDKKGHMNGRDYEAVHSNIRPDHLAVLTDELGACSYDDGCGLRSNIKGLSVNFTKAWAVISAEMAKLLPDASGTVLAIRAHAAKEGEGNEPKPGDQTKDDAMKPEEIVAMVAKTLQEGLAAFKAETDKTVKETLAAFKAEQAKATEAAERPALVAHVVACSSITKEQAEAMDFASLKVVANGLKAPTQTVATFAGRPMPVVHTAQAGDDEIVKAMTSRLGVVAAFQKKEAA